MGRKRIKTWAMIIGWLGFITAAIFAFFSNSNELPVLGAQAIPVIALVVVASLINLGATALMNHVLIHRLDHSVSMPESVTTTAVASALNYVAPLRAGAAFRSVYFKKTRRISLADFAATLVVSMAAAAVAAGLGLLAGATLSLKETGQRGITPFLIGLAPIVGALILAFLAERIPLSDRTLGLKARVSTFLRAIRGLTSDYRSGAALVALGSVQVLTVILGLGASIAAIGGSADVSSVVVVGSIGVLAVFLSFTPGGLGVYELAVAVGGSVVGDSLTLFLGAAILQRAIGVGVTLTVAAPCWLILRRSPAFPAQWTLKGLIIQDEAGERPP